MTGKAVMITEAIIDILKIFADSEIGGQYQINHEAIADYLNSLRCASDFWESSTTEEIYERFTEDIIAGLPVWRFLILPEWTLNMVETMFAAEADAEYQQYCKTYKCPTCKYYGADYTDLGLFQECTYEKNLRFSDRRILPKREPFKPKKRCKNYIRKEDIDEIHR